MSRGVLIFAFNNEKLDYFKQANWVADRVEKFLGLPTTIVTDENSVSESSHMTIFKEAHVTGQRNFDISRDDMIGNWYNANRYQAFDVTPYDETIVIDSDYIVNSDQLNLLFEQEHDFLCHRSVYDVANKNSLAPYETFGQTKMPHYWATVLFFRNSEFSLNMFNLIQMVKENYAYYSKLYKFSPNPFRNDYAVSIAMSIAYGHRLHAIPTIPWNLPTAVTDICIEQLGYDEFEITYDKHYRNKVRPMRSIIKGQDIHCLNKISMEKMIGST